MRKGPGPHVRAAPVSETVELLPALPGSQGQLEKDGQLDRHFSLHESNMRLPGIVSEDS